MQSREILVETVDLVKHFPLSSGLFKRVKGAVKAVDGVSIKVFKGETLGLVGESGCGKSTLGRLIIKLLKPTKGIIKFDGVDITKIPDKEFRPYRRRMQIIFQDPYASLNPRLTVSGIIGEAFKVHRLVHSKQEQKERIKGLLETVGLAAEHADRYPHEFSGGQRQRIGIARALAVNPEFIVADEPISALDVSIRAQILNLMVDLQEKFKLTYLFIAHDLSVIKHISDRVAVMYLGRIVELAEKNELFSKPLHPYTQALLSSVPVPDPELRQDRLILKGEVPSPINPPTGCRFHPRCRYAKDVCVNVVPEFREVLKEHYVECHLAPDLQ
ncbi:MAG: dipeptide ABC transporter ATP-binding protein [Nitrososphaerales archaeon]